MILYGHRGAKGEVPENTLEGFAHARRAGVDGIELDVRLSADGELVVIHDETVDRTTDGTGRVAEMTVGELARLDARGPFRDWPGPAGVPTLTGVLDALMGVLQITECDGCVTLDARWACLLSISTPSGPLLHG